MHTMLHCLLPNHAPLLISSSLTHHAAEYTCMLSSLPILPAIQIV